MRKVFKNRDEVAHIWASRTQEEGRAGNVNFRGDSIYSYRWWEMARFMEVKGETIVLMRNWNYSSSTSKHMSSVHGALRGLPYRIVYCYGEVSTYYGGWRANNEVLDHEQSIRHWLNEMFESQQKLKRAKYPDYEISNNHSARASIEEYCALFDLPIPDKMMEYYLDPDDIAPLLEAKKKRAEELANKTDEQREIERAKREAAEEKKLQKLRDEFMEDELAWMEGENVSTRKTIKQGRSRWNSKYLEFSTTRLRIKDDYVETSRGAFVPVREAQILWGLIKLGHDIKGHRIGSYTVIGLNGVLKIGCHEITREEMTRFTTKYGW